MTAPDARPDVLLILADDMGFSDIACYGGEIQHADRSTAWPRAASG